MTSSTGQMPAKSAKAVRKATSVLPWRKISHDVALRLSFGGVARGAREDFLEMGFRRCIERCGEELRIPFREAREVRGAGEDAAQKGCDAVREGGQVLKGGAYPFEPAAAAARFIVDGAFAQAAGKGTGLNDMAQ